MFKFLNKMKKNRKGYTLTELIVVVAILGILAAVATPMILGQVAKAETSADNANAKSISNAYKIAITEDSTADDSINNAIDAIEKTLKPIPPVKKSGNEFYIELSTGDVVCEAEKPAATRGTYVELKKTT